MKTIHARILSATTLREEARERLDIELRLSALKARVEDAIEAGIDRYSGTEFYPDSLVSAISKLHAELEKAGVESAE